MATTTVPAAKTSRLRLPEAVSVLAERDFRVVWLGQAVSMTGTWMQVVGQSLLVLELWNSAFALGALNFANAVPALAVMLFGGVLADRADKRRILVVTQAAMLLAALGIGILVAADMVEYWMLIVATLLVGVAFGYDMPAYQAYLPELVPPEKIGQVVALNSSTFHGSRMVGPAIAGATIKAWGIATAYFLNAASFVAVIASLLMVRRRHAAPAAGPQMSSLHGLKEGFRHAWGRPTLRTFLVLNALMTTFIFPILAVLMPYYVKEVLHEDEAVLGLMLAGSGVGSMLGAVALIFWTSGRASRIWIGALMAPIGVAAMAVTREPLVALAINPFVSFAFSSQLGLVQTMIQESTPAQFRGRVMSLFGITFNGTMPVAGLVGAGLAEAFGMPEVMLGAAALYLGMAAWVLLGAGGGIFSVVAAAGREHEAVAAANVVPVQAGRAD